MEPRCILGLECKQLECSDVATYPKPPVHRAICIRDTVQILDYGRSAGILDQDTLVLNWKVPIRSTVLTSPQVCHSIPKRLTNVWTSPQLEWSRPMSLHDEIYFARV